MTVWVDGDSCPRPAMEAILVHAGGKGPKIVVAADRDIPGVTAAGATMRVFASGAGDVDDFIVSESRAGDLAVTRDYGLGIRLKEAGVTVLNDKGRMWKLSELRARAEDAEIMRAVRGGRIAKKQRRSYGKEEAAEFAAAFAALVNGAGRDGLRG